MFSTLSYSDGIYVLSEKTGEKYEFANAQHKKLTAQVDRQGNRTTLSYSADSLLLQIKDTVGHTITLEYNNKLLTRASATFLNGSITYTYDSKHRLIKRTDAMGNVTSYGYDKENHLDEITDANGHKTLISYNASGMVSRLKTDVSDKSIRYDGDKTVFIDYTEPQNQYSYYRWDDKGRVIEKVGLCCGIQSKLEYDEDDNVVKRTDANGNVTSYTYDDRGNMLSLTDALGNTERYTYDTDFNQVTSFSDKNGNTYSFTYDGKGNLTALNGPAGFSNSFTYNDKGWPLTTTDANGNVTATTYNADGTTQKVMDAAGYTTTYAYNPYGNIISITDGRNNTTQYAYNKNSQIVSQTDALGNTTSVSYDKVGNIVRVKNAKNQIRAYTYDALGNVLTQTDPQGGVYTYTYDGKGNVLSVTDPVGNKQTFTWNEKNKLLTQTNAEGETTTYDYDAKGNLTSVFQPNGNVLQYFYDRLDRVEQLSDNMGVIAKYTYDGNGNQLTVTDGLDRTMTYTYDALNRRTTEVLPSGATTTYAYDGNSNLLTVTDAKGNATTYTYSSLNQQLTHTDALNAKTQFEYDGNGNLTKATDAKGNATTYAYDALNQNTAITFANGLSLQYTYDELGRVIESKDRAGNQFRYAYDVLGRLLSKTYPDNTQDRYTYDAIGQMLSAINKDATVTFTYDPAGRILSETLATGSAGVSPAVTSYAYDVAAGKRTMTYPSGMRVVEQLNARDLIASILQNGEEVVTMKYNVAGQKTAQTYANGITTNYAYNDNGWLQSIIAVSSVAGDFQSPTNIMNLQMTYDAIGNMTQRKDMLDDTRTENYGYDAISQLVSFRRGTAVDNSYQFDLLGNRVKVLENGIATNYVSNNVNAYTAITGRLSFTPQYDDNGNMLNDDKHTYAYDWNSKQVGVDDGAVTVKYDALGRRIAKNNTLFYYVGDQMVEEVTDGATTSYLYGNNIDEADNLNHRISGKVVLATIVAQAQVHENQIIGQAYFLKLTEALYGIEAGQRTPFRLGLGHRIGDVRDDAAHQFVLHFRIGKAQLPLALTADAFAFHEREPFRMRFAQLGIRQVTVKRMTPVRRTIHDASAEFKRYVRLTVAVQAVADRSTRIGRAIAIDFTIAQEGTPALVEPPERQRRSGGDVRLVVHPPANAAEILEEMIYGKERPSRSAADKYDIAAERLDCPFLVLQGNQPLRHRERRAPDMKNDVARAVYRETVGRDTKRHVFLEFRRRSLFPSRRFSRQANCPVRLTGKRDGTGRQRDRGQKYLAVHLVSLGCRDFRTGNLSERQAQSARQQPDARRCHRKTARTRDAADLQIPLRNIGEVGGVREIERYLIVGIVPSRNVDRT